MREFTSALRSLSLDPTFISLPTGSEINIEEPKTLPTLPMLRQICGTYPLAYPLAVVYPFDNSRSPIGKKLSELLLTQESQTYLTALGMVSAYPLTDLHSDPSE